jgi:hypothetical protein
MGILSSEFTPEQDQAEAKRIAEPIRFILGVLTREQAEIVLSAIDYCHYCGRDLRNEDGSRHPKCDCRDEDIR